MKNILFFIFIFAFLGCGHKIKKGEIVEMFWYEGHYYTTVIICGKVAVVTTNYAPPRYCVKIRGLKNGDTITSTYDMYKSEWDNVKMGDTISFK